MAKDSPFVRTLKQALYDQRMTARQLALKIQVNPSYITRVLAGVRPAPSDEHIIKIARVLNLDRDRLLWEAGRLPGSLRATGPLTDEDLQELRKFSEAMKERIRKRSIDGKSKSSPKG